jgi:hypothetical protein
MPPMPKPIMSACTAATSPRATPNSAWMRGRTTATEYMPEPPMVISSSDTASRVQA